MALDILNRQRKVPISIKEIRPRLEAVVTAAGVNDSEISLVFVSDAAIKRLNKEWRGINDPTDCLSFAANESPDFLDDFDGGFLGDIVISLERAKAQGPIHLADDVPVGADPLVEEVVFLFIHSLLHLLGYDHQKPVQAKKMQAEEQRLLNSPGVRW